VRPRRRAEARRGISLLESQALAMRATVELVRSSWLIGRWRAFNEAAGTCREDALADAERAAHSVCAERALGDEVLLRMQSPDAGDTEEEEA
jgi:hypothetical protein